MDRLVAMRSFARVVESGSFSAVAREQLTNQATISKRVAALEAELGTRLLVRGNREHTLTEAGQHYYRRVVNILDEIDRAESEARSLTATPRGTLRVTVPTMFGNLYIAPVLPDFLARHPEIQLDVKFSERQLDLVEEGIDVAIRLGDLQDSSMIARRLGSDDLILVASPGYLDKHGTPCHPAELLQHNCLIYSLGARGNRWQFSGQPDEAAVQVSGNFQCDTGFGLMEMLLAGAGISLMPTWLVAPYLESGQLTQFLAGYYKRYPINAVYPGNAYVPLKTKSFLTFMAEVMAADPRIRT